MKNLLCMSVVAASLIAGAAELPSELQHLKTFTDETGLVQAVRDFDKQNTAAANSEMDEAKELAQTGKKDEAKAKYEAAVAKLQTVRQAYEYAIAQFPRSARLHNYYGELVFDYFGEETTAVKEWNLAMSLDARLSAPHNNLGIYYFHSGQYQLGLDAYDRALELEPNHPDYLFNLAQAYLLYFPQVQEMRKWKKPKVYKEAMKLSKKAAESEPRDFELVQDYATNFFAAESFDVRPDWVKAAKAWEEARNLARSDVERFNAWLNEGRVWKEAGNKQKAAACFNEAVKLRPDSEVAQELLKELETEPAKPPSGSVFPKGRVQSG